MPIYEYQCYACHHTFDARQKMSDEPLKECPECGQNTVNKLVSAAGFQLKGTGWYVTDFKDQSKKTPEKATQPSQPAQKESKSQKTATKTSGSVD
ncbi:MAG: zinc ribbon domain-containing protein [Legionellaceae bacterium]|nr:zinc ribbon domain-containing protein [Legionellaceae bacterium]